MKFITEHLDAYSEALGPLREAAGRYLKNPSVLARDGSIKIGYSVIVLTAMSGVPEATPLVSQVDSP
jgi:hypothetical protein